MGDILNLYTLLEYVLTLRIALARAAKNDRQAEELVSARGHLRISKTHVKEVTRA